MSLDIVMSIGQVVQPTNVLQALYKGNRITWQSKKKTNMYHQVFKPSIELYGNCHQQKDVAALPYAGTGSFIFLPMHLHYNNQVTLHIAANPFFIQRTQHIEAYCHFVWKKMSSKQITSIYAQFRDQFADFLTKAHGPTHLTSTIGKLGTYDIHAPT